MAWNRLLAGFDAQYWFETFGQVDGDDGFWLRVLEKRRGEKRPGGSEARVYFYLRHRILFMGISFLFDLE